MQVKTDVLSDREADHSRDYDSTNTHQSKADNSYISGSELAVFRQYYQEMRATIVADKIANIRNLDNFPEDYEIGEFLRWQHAHPDIKAHEYWCSTTPTKEDRQCLTELHGAVFHDQLGDLIKSKVQILQSPQCEHPPQNKLLLDEILAGYRYLITSRSENLQRTIVTSGYPGKNSELFNFNGLDVQFDNQSFDLSRSSIEVVKGLLSNIVCDKRFMYYSTEELVNLYFSKQHFAFHNRIYLNPSLHASVKVFGDLIDRFEEYSLPINMKIFNRAFEAGHKHQYGSVRADGIIIYTNHEHTDTALQLVLSCYMQHYSSFEDRVSPKLTTQIAPGVSLATHEGFDEEKYSFLTHRSYMFDQAWEHFKFIQEFNPTASFSNQDIYTFKQLLIQECDKRQVDKRNISFPAFMPAKLNL